jgi:hypothetical protein
MVIDVGCWLAAVVAVVRTGAAELVQDWLVVEYVYQDLLVASCP